jgi:hypothetical protein
MQTARSWFGAIGGLIPVLFFGGLFFYLSSVNNAFYGLLDGALGPTRIGVGGLALLFFVLFLWRLRRLAAPPAPPKDKVGDRVDQALAETKSDFDADAAMARYLARRGTGTSAPAAAGPSPAFGSGEAPVRPAGGFGRKGTLG